MECISLKKTRSRKPNSCRPMSLGLPNSSLIPNTIKLYPAFPPHLPTHTHTDIQPFKGAWLNPSGITSHFKPGWDPQTLFITKMLSVQSRSLILFVKLWQHRHNVIFTILMNFECPALTRFTFLCNHHCLPSLELFLSSQTETLHPLTHNSSLPSP